VLASGSIQTWVHLGCNRASRGFLWALKQAIGAVRFQSVTSEPSADTEEVDGSSPFGPTISSLCSIFLPVIPYLCCRFSAHQPRIGDNVSALLIATCPADGSLAFNAAILGATVFLTAADVAMIGRL
jgi:hypothetical protein